MMEWALGEIPIQFSDQDINDLLRARIDHGGSYTRHFSATEDFFVRVSEPIEIPSFPIHHDYRTSHPSKEYTGALRRVVDQVTAQIPQITAGLKHLFDPGEILSPAFYHLYRIDGIEYLYLLKMNLRYDPVGHETIARGNNDTTAAYRTDRIPLEADLVPLQTARRERGKVAAFLVDQPISQTWIGETGRGYFVQGIWMDRELTKFFSKLVLPPDRRTYPYYPVTCKYRSICYAVTQLEAEQRKKWVVRLHKMRKLLSPHIESIQSTLKHQDFSEELELFRELKGRIPQSWHEWYNSLKLTVYLNGRDMREFVLED